MSPEIHLFRLSDAKRSRLADLLNDPVMKEALEILEFSSLPTRTPRPPDPTIPYETYIAHKYRELQGRVAVIRDLKNMIEPVPKSEEVSREDFVENVMSVVKDQASKKYPHLFPEYQQLNNHD